jgi:hypothetical protein
MEPDEKERHRKNLLVGWAIGIIAICISLHFIMAQVKVNEQ